MAPYIIAGIAIGICTAIIILALGILKDSREISRKKKGEKPFMF